MEFANLGAHCEYSLCGQQTYLPFTCQGCSHKFCTEHAKALDHKCPSSHKEQPKPVIKPIKSKKKEKKCRRRGCKKLSCIQCENCFKRYCMFHRHSDDHKCTPITSKFNNSKINKITNTGLKLNQKRIKYFTKFLENKNEKDCGNEMNKYNKNENHNINKKFISSH